MTHGTNRSPLTAGPRPLPPTKARLDAAEALP